MSVGETGEVGMRWVIGGWEGAWDTAAQMGAYDTETASGKSGGGSTAG